MNITTPVWLKVNETRMTEAEALAFVKKWVGRHDTAKAAAKELGVSAQFLSEVLKGYKAPHSIMMKFGFEKHVYYKKKAKP